MTREQLRDRISELPDEGAHFVATYIAEFDPVLVAKALQRWAEYQRSREPVAR